MKAMEIEHDPRLARILATRRILFGIQGGVLALFAFYVMLANGLSLVPIFFPLYNVILLGSLMLLMVAVERIFFFRLCIVYGKRSGAKFLIARKRFRGSAAMIGVAALLSLFLIALTFTPMLNQNGDVGGQLGTVEFDANNLFALSEVGSITINNLGLNSLTFVIVSSGNYYAAGATTATANESALLLVSLNQGNDFVAPGGSTTASVPTTVNSHYFLVIFPSTGTVRAGYTLGMKAMPSLFYALLMSFATLPISAYLAGYARIQMKRLRTATIFT